MSVALHAALLVGWLMRPPPPLEPPAVVEVALLPPDFARATPPEPQAAPQPSAAQAPAEAVDVVRPREAPAAAPASPITVAPAAPQAPAAAPLAPGAAPGPAGATTPAPLSGLAARMVCQDLDALSAADRERCTQLVMAAPERAVRGTRYARMQEHAAVMAKVRRAENTGYRQSCEALRNFDTTCPSALPDNLPDDFVLPRD